MHPVASYARVAYAQGLAVVGAPITDRVKAGCIAAIELAIEHADDPDVLEATLQLGALEGVWALIYQRRENLHTDNERRVTAAWKALGLRKLAPIIVAAARRRAGLTEAAGQDEWLTDLIRNNVTANVGDWTGLLDSLHASILNAQAEGNAAAQALQADNLATVGFSFDIAFEDAYKALERNADMAAGTAETDAWLAQLLGSNASDIAAKLGALTRAGASYEDMTAEVGDILEGASGRSIATAVDVLTSRALSRGALDLYRSDGLQYVDFLSAGDQRVCPICLGLERKNPYRIEDAPLSGQHPYCVVGSTRVEAPLSAVMVAGEPVGLSSHDAEVGAAVPGETGPLAATAVAEAVRDYGRGNIRAATHREYVGEIITIRTALGHELTGTPNHPVATRQGWVPLAELAVGDNVLSSTRPEWVGVVGVDPDVDHIPPRIEDVAQTFPVLLGPVPTAAKDFHGDGAGSEVHVVRTDRLLGHDHAATLAQHLGESQFGRGGVAVDPALPPYGLRTEFLVGVLHTSDSVMGGGGDSLSLLDIGAAHADVHGVASAADRGSGHFEKAPDRCAADTEGFCERLLALSGEIALDDIVSVETRTASASFPCHVYNLDTVEGWYIGNGIVNHNCRCALAPAEHPANNLLAQAAQVTQPAADTTRALSSRVKSGVASTKALGGGYSATTDLVTLKDGSQAVRKVALAYGEREAAAATDAELLAGQLGRELGLPMPNVIKTSADTVWMEYVANSETALERAGYYGAVGNPALEALADSDVGRSIGLFDLAVANRDRNDGNWLIDEASKIWAIDHGFAFEQFSTLQETIDTLSVRNIFVRQVLKDGWSVADVQSMREALRRLEPKFKKLRRTKWYRDMLEQLDDLERIASGEGTLFA